MAEIDPDPLAALESRLGYRFSKRELLETALTHRSQAYESGEQHGGTYERLEFLGDALLGMLVAEWLYRDDAEATEGRLSRRRQTVVRAATLAGVAFELGLDEAIRLGKGEEQSGGRAKPSLLADAFEAVLGAIYLDGGIRAARAFVRRVLGPTLKSTGAADWVAEDPKTRLQEAVQGRLRRTPRYRIVTASGPAHALDFEVEVLLDGAVLGRGRGTSRKQAEQAAAKQALGRISPEGD